MPIQVEAQNRMLNHIEVVFRPGEKAMAMELFDLLGCRVRDKGGPGFIAHADGDKPSRIYNIIYVSEVSPEQWRFEEQLQRQLGQDGPLADAYAGFDALVRRLPYKATHFGVRLDSLQRFEETVARLRITHSSALAGRMELASVLRPGDEDSPIGFMAQAFVRTDVVAAGLLCLGQRIEVCAPVEGSG